MIVSKIVKYFENNIDNIFKIIYGSEVDEYDDLYSNVYKCEVRNFIELIERNLNKLERCGIIFGVNELYQSFLTYWFDTNKLEDINVCNKLRVFIRNILHEIYYNENSETKLDVSENENKYIISLLNKKLSESENYLCNLKIDNDNTDKKLFNMIKEQKGEEYCNEIIKDRVDKYIKLNNIIFKLTNNKPNSILFQSTCKLYNIKRSEFIF